MMPKHIFWPIIDSSSLLPEIHAVNVLYYVEKVGVVTSGHVTKMTVKPFNPPLRKPSAIRKLHGKGRYGSFP